MKLWCSISPYPQTRVLYSFSWYLITYGHGPEEIPQAVVWDLPWEGGWEGRFLLFPTLCYHRQYGGFRPLPGTHWIMFLFLGLWGNTGPVLDFVKMT